MPAAAGSWCQGGAKVVPRWCQGGSRMVWQDGAASGAKNSLSGALHPLQLGCCHEVELEVRCEGHAFFFWHLTHSVFWHLNHSAIRPRHINKTPDRRPYEPAAYYPAMSTCHQHDTAMVVSPACNRHANQQRQQHTHTQPTVQPSTLRKSEPEKRGRDLRRMGSRPVGLFLA